MPKDGKYRITSPTIALFLEDGRHVAHTVPGGSIINIDLETFNGDKLVNVLWADKRVMMFVQDVISRGVKIPE